MFSGVIKKREIGDNYKGFLCPLILVGQQK